MTANGLVIYYLLSLAAFAAGRNDLVPWAAVALCVVLAIGSGASPLKLVARTAIVALPLVGWLTLIWVGIGPPPPSVLLVYQPPAATTPLSLVTALGIRFFAFALLTLAAAEKGKRIRPSFALRLSLPRDAKIVLLAASSLSHAFVEGVRRAHTALVAANVITPRRSAKNLRNGWVLLRTSWVATLGVATERLDTKWQFENLPEAVPFDRIARPAFSLPDLCWLIPAAAAAALQAAWM
ncbi:MAG: hypothetical protein JWN66_392 [Sphingomonas bacterium]|uniref:hypothetical protein n=1 Tax=Sphingomonas bacterium TaxID=1895847 RepID=UPI0026149F5A|nr:hypothetical protein [Sphingomonas bacterium]MDB5703276.1 hypothetical protein [Sphingomonas bacterium]